MGLLTIFTPTYNRAYILPKLYKSLVNQSDPCFEWVIVDDGSSDQTEQLVNTWIKEGILNIVYKKQRNQGKHIAINTGLSIANGELFFIVDSDDDLVSDAVYLVRGFWKYNNPDSNISGILSYRQFRDGRLVGTSLPLGLNKCKLREANSKYGSNGDKVVIYRTNIMRQYLFPKFEGENFLCESIMYNQIDDDYDMLVMNSRVYNFEYQNDGLSQDFRELYRRNPRGFLCKFEQDSKYLNSFKSKLKNAAHVVCLRLHLKKWRHYFSSCNLLIGLLAFPIGIFLYYRIFVIKVSDVKPFVKSENIKI